MQATSSHVTITTDTITDPLIVAGLNEIEAGPNLAPALMQTGIASERVRILDSRRKRASRRSVR